MNYRTAYTAKEIEQLRILFAQGNSDEQIAAVLGRSEFSIRNKRLQLGLKHPNAADMAAEKAKHWSPDEELFIRNYWQQKSDSWMAKKLRVKLNIYIYKRKKMGLKKNWRVKPGIRHSWKFTDEEFLRQHYGRHSCQDIAAHLGGRHSIDSIYKKALRLGLKKDYCNCGKHYPLIDANYQPIERSEP